ncbi:MAG: T9SS type A sorting domain-containing protein [bacterium]|nr:T9SS type A sorting domain-containing protein [bacterium]
MIRTFLIISLLVLVHLPGGAGAALIPAEHPLFADDAVHEIRLTFHQGNWWNQLEDNFEGQSDPDYLAAEFDWNGVHFDSIGVRFKGNSSYMSYPGVKKSFKLDIDEYVTDQEIDGLDKLNLNNSFLDPSFVREKACYELCDAVGLAAGRTNFAALYINDEYWGLYTLIEQIDQEFLESRYGASEDGNLWKGEPNGTFEYRGASESSYYSSYELKTNEETNDWSDLVEIMDLLNNTPVSNLPDSLHNTMDVHSALAMLAIDLFTVNLDSYVGRCANYYFYHRELDDRIVFLKWDMNEAWGLFNMWHYSATQLHQFDIWWSNTQSGANRPLAEILWSVPAYQDIYVGHIQRLMAGAADPDLLVARMDALRDLIRPYVLSDTNKMFSNSEFESAMNSNIYEGNRLIPALETFVRSRDSWLQTEIGEWTAIDDLVINEIMADNNTTIADEFGDYEDWVEITNTGDAPISLNGLALTDHHDGSAHYTFPDVSLPAGEHMLIWCDEEPGEGDYHAPFKLDGDGEDLFLLDETGSVPVIIGQVTFPALSADLSWGRWADGTGDWQLLSLATPGTANQNPEAPEEIVLFINEFLAANSSTNQDETGAFADWVEIYNPGPDAVEMGGLFLTDDLSMPTKWIFPESTLDAHDYLLVWCDNDEEDGPLHTSFKLSAGGESIAIFGRLSAGNEVIDSYDFGPQTTDISEGRSPDGTEHWDLFDIPTPGDSNNATGATGTTPSAQLTLRNFPNPFNPRTDLQLNLPQAGHARLEIFNVSGRRVMRLFDDVLPAGISTITWDGRNGEGVEQTSGLYFCRLEANGKTVTSRMTLLR